jgi:hypothetical protein
VPKYVSSQYGQYASTLISIMHTYLIRISERVGVEVGDVPNRSACFTISYKLNTRYTETRSEDDDAAVSAVGASISLLLIPLIET